MIASTYLHYLRKDPDESVGDFMEKIHEKMNVEISVSQVYRAKRIAKDMTEGYYKKQQAKLENYCTELKEKNPGSIILLETIPSEKDDKSIFEEFTYVLSPAKEVERQVVGYLLGWVVALLKDHMVVNFDNNCDRC